MLGFIQLKEVNVNIDIIKAIIKKLVTLVKLCV
jgi:hypothetical protein